jgi:hypothetical protein
MTFTWYSCTKQDVVQDDTSYDLREKISKGLAKAEAKLPFKASYNSIEYRELESSCLDSTDYQCDNYAFIGTLEDFTVPFNDSCNMKITVDIHKCERYYGTKTIVTYIFDSFDAYPIEGECDYLTEYWKELGELGEFDILAEAMDSFFVEASMIAENYLMTIFVTLNGEQFACGELNTAIKSDFYYSNCFQYYGILTKDDRGGLKFRGGEIGIEPVDNEYIPRLKCGESCCLRQTAYCVKRDGSINTSSPIISQIGECDATQAEIPDIPGIYPFGECTHECE